MMLWFPGWINLWQRYGIQPRCICCLYGTCFAFVGCRVPHETSKRPGMMTPPVTPVTFIRGAPINVPHFGPIGVRIVSGQKAQLATGGEDGSELLSEKDWWKWWKNGFFLTENLQETLALSSFREGESLIIRYPSSNSGEHELGIELGYANVLEDILFQLGNLE